MQDFRSRDQKRNDDYAETARRNREFYLAHIKAEFSEKQAIKLLKVSILAGKQ